MLTLTVLTAQPSEAESWLLAYLLDLAGAVVRAVADVELAGVDGVVVAARVHALHVLVAHERRDLAEQEEDDDGADHEPRRAERRRRRRREAEATSLARRATPPVCTRHSSAYRFMRRGGRSPSKGSEVGFINESSSGL